MRAQGPACTVTMPLAANALTNTREISVTEMLRAFQDFVLVNFFLFSFLSTSILLLTESFKVYSQKIQNTYH
jgi:hypothetical protein